MVGQTLGPYQIVAKLGEGGMGEVYRGLDTRLGRAVALKVISPHLVGDEASRRRFETEARAASALNHPAIVTLYDIGESQGLSWMAMELVEGRTLREIIAEGPLTIKRAWSIAKQLADGLAVAHAKGVVHRDMKPANVMVTDDGRVKILDFGLARQTAASVLGAAPSADTVTASDTSGTVAGAILGTVGYMSPEQAMGRPADFRSDQFSFGVVVYELLAGRRAFDRPTTIETIAAIVRDEPIPLASLRRDLSAAFQRVIDRCLEKQPEQRFESTREMAAALEALTPDSSAAIVGAGASAFDPGAETVRVPRPAARRLRVVLPAVMMLAAVAGGAWLWNTSGRPASPAIASLAVLPFDNTSDDPEIDYIGDGVTDGLIDHLSRVRSLKVMARATVMRFKGEADPQRAARTLGVGAVVTGAVSRRGEQVVIAAELIHAGTGERLWGQSFDRPIADLMRVQDAIVVSIADGLRLRLTGEEKARLAGFGTDNPEAYELVLKGKYLLQRDTEEDDLEALRLFELAAQKDPNFIDAHLAISSIHARSIGSGYAMPADAEARADAALTSAVAIDPNNVAVRLALANRRFIKTRNWAETEQEYRALMHEPAVLRTVSFHPIALFFVALGRPDEAAALVERALVVDPGNLESRVMLGNFLLQAGRLDEALRVYEALAAEEPGDARPLFGVADVHKRRGAFQRAAETRRKAYELYGDQEGARAFARVTTEAEYAKAEVTLARAELRELEALALQRYIPPFDIVRLHAQIGNRELALSGLERLLDKDESGFGYVGLMLLKVDQAWDSVRADPRFAAIVRRVGIP